MALYIARAFGACSACWGLNRLCAECHGNGAPGYREPQLDVLLTWLNPALERLGLRVVAATHAAHAAPLDGDSPIHKTAP